MKDVLINLLVGAVFIVSIAVLLDQYPGAMAMTVTIGLGTLFVVAVSAITYNIGVAVRGLLRAIGIMR